MSERSEDAMEQAARDANKLYAAMIKLQMDKQGASARNLAKKGVIKSHRRARFIEKLGAGDVTLAEFQKVLIHLDVDPIRAGIVLQSQQAASFYEDPCCQTTALVASKLAVHLPSELAACEGRFEPLRHSLGDSIAKRYASAIARHHKQIERRRNGDDFDHLWD